MSRSVLPLPLARAIERHTGDTVVASRRCGGGCINQAAIVEVGSGNRLFVKWNPSAPPGFLHAEQHGLELLRSSATVDVPEVLGLVLAPVDEPSYGQALLLAAVATGGGQDSVRTVGAEAGRRLALLHQKRCEGTFGLAEANFIGSLPQDNTPCPLWLDFFRTRRLDALASVLPSRVRARLDALPLEALLTEPTRGPSLLHGDLWSGNILPSPGGNAWYIDPAVYRGHPEVDLAMTVLFGRFPATFYDGYQEIAGPFDPDLDARLDLYNLYPLLVHAHLFGGSYIRQIDQTLERFVP